MVGPNTVPTGISELEDISLRRLSFKHSGNCVQCGYLDKDTHPKVSRLTINFTDCYISLCPIHEGELLQVLLNNYLRRHTKGSKQGYTGPLSKASPEEDQEAEDFED